MLHPYNEEKAKNNEKHEAPWNQKHENAKLQTLDFENVLGVCANEALE